MQLLALVLVGQRGLPSLASYEVLEHLRGKASGLTLQVIRHETHEHHGEHESMNHLARAS
eukprot:1160443-Pelagomonas_calceolata.AAC.7